MINGGDRDSRNGPQCATLRPIYPGHLQPQIPTTLGYYSLDEPETLHRQFSLASGHGITAFCMYAYWFSGRRLLEKPLRISSGLRVSGSATSFVGQTKAGREPGTVERTIFCCSNVTLRTVMFGSLTTWRSILPTTVTCGSNGDPLFLIYRAELLDEPRRTIDSLRKRAQETRYWRPSPVDGPELQPSGPGRLRIRFQRLSSYPIGSVEPPTSLIHRVQSHRSSTTHCHGPGPSLTTTVRFNGLCQSPHRSSGGFAQRCPAGTIHHVGEIDLSSTSTTTHRRFVDGSTASSTTRFGSEIPKPDCIFINSWNEWGEGTQLEPDLDRGDARISAVASAVERAYALSRSGER